MEVLPDLGADRLHRNAAAARSANTTQNVSVKMRVFARSLPC